MIDDTAQFYFSEAMPLAHATWQRCVSEGLCHFPQQIRLRARFLYQMFIYKEGC